MRGYSRGVLAERLKVRLFKNPRGSYTCRSIAAQNRNTGTTMVCRSVIMLALHNLFSASRLMLFQNPDTNLLYGMARRAKKVETEQG